MVGNSLFRKAIGLFAAVFAAASAFAPAWAADLKDVRFGISSKTETRIVFDLSGPAPYGVFVDDEGQGRLIVELRGVKAAAGAAGSGVGHVAGYKVTSDAAGVEATISLARTARINRHFVIPAKAAGENTRLVVDLIESDRAGLLASAPKREKYQDIAAVIEAATAPAPAKATAPSKTSLAVAPVPAPSLAPAPERETYFRPGEKPVIVIDAGHGGNDPGAIGPNGTREKTVTLAAALELADLLKARERYEVVLIRGGDTRIEVADRLEAARKARADLFISIHADAHGDRSLRGASVYTLSDEGTKRSTKEALSQGDYQLFDINIRDESPDLRPILLDLAQTHTKNRSGQFADLLIENLSGVTPLINNTHRTADLKVLLSPDVAAVLLELAFISNAKDEANLTSPAWRRKTMAAVANAIDNYFQARTATHHASRGAEGAH